MLNEPWEPLNLQGNKADFLPGEKELQRTFKAELRIMEELTTEMEEGDGDLKGIQEKAHLIVEGVIKGALDSITDMQKKEAAAAARYDVPNIKWMSCEEFTISKGLIQIEAYLKTWELHESWLHWTTYLHEEEEQYCNKYHYRVRWSIPTCRKPIPRATACVYFIIVISKIKPPTLPVEVYFLVETNKLIHRPGESRFKEKWLKDVIESKISMMEGVSF
uniref:A-kinase anchoring protein 14 n=1 Tax=Salvator merianae TaxID=96440 RepID=A0A8D0DWP5_SALMN